VLSVTTIPTGLHPAADPVNAAPGTSPAPSTRLKSTSKEEKWDDFGDDWDKDE
jgi:hypothetical protein